MLRPWHTSDPFMSVTPAIITVSLNPAIDRTIEVDNFTIGAHQVGRELRRTPGGKGVNVSRILAALDVPSIATGFLGSENRAAFEPMLENPLVLDEFFSLPGRTRENVTITDRQTCRETHIRDVGLAVPGPYYDRLAKKLQLVTRPDSIAIFSGSVPPGITGEDFADLVGTCVVAGARVAVDTSGPALAAVAEMPLWLIKPNATELSELVGKSLRTRPQQIRAAKRLTETIQTVVLTRGDQGAYLFTSDLALHARVPIAPDRIGNTVGCGDALLGAYAAAICNGLPVPEAFAEAVATATATACTLSPAEFEPKTLKHLRKHVELTEL